MGILKDVETEAEEDVEGHRVMVVLESLDAARGVVSSLPTSVS